MAGASKPEPRVTSKGRIGILGTGRVAQALATGLVRAGYEVRLGSRQPEKSRATEAGFPMGVSVRSQRDAVAFGDVVVLAVPQKAVHELVSTLGPDSFSGKTVIDVSNAPYEVALGRSTSCAEELAKLVPGAHVVKGFNIVFARHMTTGKIGGERLLALVAGDSPAAKERTLALARDIGFDAVDAGPLSSARYVEAIALQNIALGYGLKMGTGIGLKLVRTEEPA